MKRPFILFVAFVFGVFGVVYLLFPEPLALSSGLQPTASGLTDVRATYGGFQIAFALFLGWTSLSVDRFRAGLVAIFWVAAWVGFGRILGLILDGEPSTFHTIGLIFEIPLTLVALWLLRQKDGFG